MKLSIVAKLHIAWFLLTVLWCGTIAFSAVTGYIWPEVFSGGLRLAVYGMCGIIGGMFLAEQRYKHSYDMNIKNECESCWDLFKTNAFIIMTFEIVGTVLCHT